MSRPLRAAVRDFAFRHVGGTALVLIYHRVADLERDPQLLAVGTSHFADQMAMLAATYRVTRLAELVAGLRRRRVSDRTVVVTFDDGYADNLQHAAPVLQRNGVAATVFVNSGYVDSHEEFWWDELEHIVLSPGTLPPEIRLEASTGRIVSTSEDCESYSEDDAARDRGWNMLQSDSNGRERLYRELCTFFRPLSSTDRTDALRQLRDQAGVAAEVRTSHRQLTATEVRELDCLDGVDVGAHTRSHHVLAERTAAEQREEILTDRDTLARICGHRIPLLSYPYGGPDALDDVTVGLVRDAGFLGACANHPGVVKQWTDPFRIPRVLVRDWSAERLADTIEGWFDDPR
jgi:peptidoglycan/xylan/chitin deacetylase (PgdA/CDA1 family)